MTVRRPSRLIRVLVALAAGLAALTPATAAPARTPYFGSMGGRPLNAPIVAVARTPDGGGYYLGASDGGVFAFGNARFHGSLGGTRLNGDIVDLALTPDGGGYWMVGRDGGVFTFGNARFHGSLGGTPLNGEIVAIAPTWDGGGYLLLGADGGVFAFGNARFHGSLGDRQIWSRAVGIVPRLQGTGYWIATADGQVYGLGGGYPSWYGELSGRLNAPIVGIAPAADGLGYVLAAADGGVFTFGSARFHGSLGGSRLAGPIVDLALTPTGDGYWLAARDGGVFTFPGTSLPPSGTPALTVRTIASGLDIPWDLAFLPGGTLVFTERPGRISAIVDGRVRLLGTVSDVRVEGEGGLTGLAVDPEFRANRRIYTCHNSTAGDIRLVVWTVNISETAVSRVGDLLTGLPANSSGRHSGCRPRFGPDGYLWVGTGDAAGGTNPQDPGSLGGKVLRIDKSTGAAAPDNPGGYRWYTRGHRNVQGLAFRPGSALPYAVEHGPDRDDEINRLVAGGNYGWDPTPGYDESVPMTDTARFPGAERAVWSSGYPTIATSGGTFLEGGQWKDWNGALAVCTLKGEHLRLFFVDSAGTGVYAERVVLTGYGRLRTPVQGPNGSLYVTTSNGGDDRILRITPS